MLDKFFKTIEKITPSKYRWILNHDGFKRYFANTGWMFFGQMFSLLVSFFIAAWLARYLGPDNYGILNYAVAFAGLFAFIASLGVDGILSRELIKYPDKRDKLLGTAYILKLIGGVIACFFVIISALFLQDNFFIKLLIIIFSFSFILQSINVISIYFQSRVESKNNVKVILFSTIVSSILKIFAIFLEKGVLWIIIIYVLDIVWQNVGFLVVYNKFGLKVKNWKFDKGLATTILKNSWPLMLAMAAYFIYLRVDQVMIGYFLGNREVGIYSAAVRLVEVWYFIPGIICSSLFPAIVNAKKISLELYKRRLKLFYFLMAIIPIAMAIPTTFFSKQIIYLLFGSGYLESAGILKIYIWSSIGIFLGSAVGQYLMLENLVKLVFWLNFVAMCLNVILNLFLIPILGLTGAAWATLFSCLLVPLGAFLLNRKYIFLKINH